MYKIYKFYASNQESIYGWGNAEDAEWFLSTLDDVYNKTTCVSAQEVATQEANNNVINLEDARCEAGEAERLEAADVVIYSK